MATASSLKNRLQALDGKPYGALRSLTGSYTFDGFTLRIDQVQSDPYAPPSRVRLIVPLPSTQLPSEVLETRQQQVAVRDFIARDIADAVAHGPREFGFVAPGQEILNRSSVVVTDEVLEVRLTFAFPAAGRRVKGRLAAELLTEELADLVRYSALGADLEVVKLREHVATYTDFLWIQQQLEERGLVAFVANGSALARSSGASDTPSQRNVPFTSPDSLSTSFTTPSGRRLTGLGIGQGITLIVGGGYHGKSTLLQAIERGVYAHVPGDGREFVVTASAAVSVRAEDGRSVAGVDISPFIAGLPGGVSTEVFSTANASGSTSQAAGIAEALEIGSNLLLIDEDTSATNFMIRDEAMRALINASHEPITPFVDRVRGLYEGVGVSTVMVVGGSGAFFGLADTVIALTEYVPSDVTARAHEIAGSSPITRSSGDTDFWVDYLRELPRSPRGLGMGNVRKPPRAKGLQTIQVDRQEIDVRALSQLTDAAQTQAIARALLLVEKKLAHDMSLARAVHETCGDLEVKDLDILAPARGDMAAPRASELMGAISRWRGIK
ncbi:ABC-ATPase domain-containing protein [Rothia sp. ZJ1223]|uniref:ABC-ATPase domain-containing protein n=1 Tax=Rothia sp. ZJ1223 TaxID=2811098 RepID=UPI00195B636A|nr:ABC-ATPase domain-containing protein [Rothia sp. ZJ1223]MBM7050792.1 ABC-ATPase domain-containing protein [Rothia sp. ZJ1223]